ncbi:MULTISPECIES: IclR family transcriptional regulator [Aeromicrobium]|uniref:Glycerol operon regulatory protein n=1 Tax=Aeromicrobium yanjiei TaxID=2662028 RepID=A0A5Q2MI18_9ACTN|nr:MULTISPECIES: IclR family transcriptional regulator [Aeromicrobium]MRK00877.1 helix-turn-helix domain-containing protein [Aeromicrobium sp. S22]QGG42308.1 helix-turn-helix domain-containing protein [Aeromicrobium yanjiei]
MSNEATRPAGAKAVTSAVQSVDRALAILEILAHDGESGVTDIAAQLEVHKSTAFRLIATLERRGLVEQNDDRGKYRLGVGILRLAGATTARLDVVQEARPLARALAAATRETVNIAVLSEGAALYLDQIAGGSSLQSHNWVGQRIPLHATANGKALLSGLDPAEIGAAVSTPLRAYTDTTVTTVKALLTDVAAVREAGYAIAMDELEHGLTAVAAPVRNAHGDVIASLSVSGPTFRFDEERLSETVRSVVETAQEVSERLGWRARDRGGVAENA